MKHLFTAALIAGTMALSTAGASAAGIGIQIGPAYGMHHHYFHHRICERNRFGYRHCFWR